LLLPGLEFDQGIGLLDGGGLELLEVALQQLDFGVECFYFLLGALLVLFGDLEHFEGLVEVLLEERDGLRVLLR
jgi:hypothetical protein